MFFKNKVKKFVQKHKRTRRIARWLWQKTKWPWLLDYWVMFTGIDLPIMAAKMPALELDKLAQVQPCVPSSSISAIFEDGKEVNIDNAYVKSVDMTEDGVIVCYGWW
jgi:hypothetical protein